MTLNVPSMKVMCGNIKKTRYPKIISFFCNGLEPRSICMANSASSSGKISTSDVTGVNGSPFFLFLYCAPQGTTATPIRRWKLRTRKCSSTMMGSSRMQRQPFLFCVVSEKLPVTSFLSRFCVFIQHFA
ncbi:hypothetical protein CEXT_679051 [Caerostris extrusa]|uniref:Uncharacterized protein n=1 Tax=Caerostris extrusa TaxID=172846 RepID=A0AAV4SVG5_CAEEX|nr:hypothetical protein CEXT_679051 [Caerostris extrusa]